MKTINEYKMILEAEDPIRQRATDWIVKAKTHYKNFPNEKKTYKPGEYEVVEQPSIVFKLTKEMSLDDIALYLAEYVKFIADYNLVIKPSEGKTMKFTKYTVKGQKNVELKIPDVAK